MSPSIEIPASDVIVDVRIFNTAALDAPALFFTHPVLSGRERLLAPAYAFLIEHHAQNKKVIFDLGVRKRPETGAPASWNRLEQAGFKAFVDKDVATQLTEGGVDLTTVNTIIWRQESYVISDTRLTYDVVSHSHFDHTGDPSTFPHTTELVIGPGTKEHFFPPYPENPEGELLASDFEGRKVTELAHGDFPLIIGGFKACDYFADGSLYLLDTPGHCPGHMTALARVTPTTFILMGGDTCHHAGQFRPNGWIENHMPCPSSLLANISKTHFTQQVQKFNTPLLTIPQQPPSAYPDEPKSIESIAKLGAFDGHPDIFVILAHDASIEHLLAYFPAKANDWKEKGWKDTTWDFLRKDNKAFRFTPA